MKKVIVLMGLCVLGVQALADVSVSSSTTTITTGTREMKMVGSMSTTEVVDTKKGMASITRADNSNPNIDPITTTSTSTGEGETFAYGKSEFESKYVGTYMGAEYMVSAGNIYSVSGTNIANGKRSGESTTNVTGGGASSETAINTVVDSSGNMTASNKVITEHTIDKLKSTITDKYSETADATTHYQRIYTDYYQ